MRRISKRPLILPAALTTILLAACGGGEPAAPEQAQEAAKPPGQAMAGPASPEGLVVMDSEFDVDETFERLDTAVAESPATVLGEVDHSDNAERAGEQLRPTKLLIVGNPALGTPLMKASPTAGIDLPQKFLVYEDEDGQVKLAYNDPSYVTERHGITGQDAVLEKISKALRMFARKATQKDGKQKDGTSSGSEDGSS